MINAKASLREVPDTSCEPLSKLNSGAISNFSFHIHGEGGHVEIKGSGEVFVSNLVLTDAAQLFWSAVSKMGVGYKTRCEELEAENAKLKKALEFYADENHYVLMIKGKKARENFVKQYGDSVEADQGVIATAALKE